MSQFYNGTSAYKLDEYERYAKQHDEKRVVRKNEQKRARAAFCRFVTIAVLCMFVVASGFIYLNVMMLRAATKVEVLKDELALVTEQNNHKKMEISQKLDLKLIEEKAINELGMQKPDNSQIIYVGVKQASYTEVESKTSVGKAVVELVKNATGGFVEYFTN